MKLSAKWVVVVFVALLAAYASADTLAVTGSSDAMALAQALVGPGITVTSASLTGVTNQQGTFTGGTGNLPFATGIILTSGSINNALGPNNSTGAGTNVGTGGNALLNGLIPGYSTYDANVLTFSFIPTNNVISFQYVFGSEEYDEYVGSVYNDVFGFFLNGSNIALIPGTSTPVSINNVNCGTNSSWYTGNNSYGGGSFGSCGNAGLNLQYDGFVGLSKALYATGPVNPNVENTIILAIADAGDHILDSGVFLAGGSFKPEPPPEIPEPGSMILLGSGLFGLAGVIRRKLAR